MPNPNTFDEATAATEEMFANSEQLSLEDVPPVENPPVVDSTSEETSDTTSSDAGILGCVSVIAAPAILPVFGVAVVLLKKREN